MKKIYKWSVENVKAKDLIGILKNNPDAEIVVSTVGYYEKSHYEAGYKREKPQDVYGFTVDLENNRIELSGGKERMI